MTDDTRRGNRPRFSSNSRLQLWYAVLIIVAAVFIGRLFYLQVIKHDYYKTQAMSGQLKEYVIPAKRGAVMAHDGDRLVPVVLNESQYTLFADPKYIKDSSKVAEELTKITNGDKSKYQQEMERDDTRYVVLAKKLDEKTKESIEKLEFKGVGLREVSYRTYPQGALAAQVLGFVDDEGNGRYGVEEALNSELRGRDGLLKAITDASGVPLVSNSDNIQINPTDGKRVVLTVDVAMQKQLEEILKLGLDRAKSSSGSAIIMNANTGEVKAVVNYPTFNPDEFTKQSDANAFNNAAFSSALEPGSVMKPLTLAAALNQGVVSKDSSYYDPGFVRIGDATVTNVEEAGGAGTRSMRDILQKSLNTGATYLLQQMGGGSINEKGRSAWYDYMDGHYKFGQKTGIESYEETGLIPDPKEGDGLNIRFANSAFGQGMTVTPLQLAAALSSVVNGGTYYKPTLIDKYIEADGTENDVQPKALRQNSVSQQVSSTIREFMKYTVDNNNLPAKRDGYNVGGKTGTAQIAKPGGGYYEDRYNGMYVGFVGGEKPEYVIIVRVNQPGIAGYAGSRAAGPIFTDVSNMLINGFNISSTL